MNAVPAKSALQARRFYGRLKTESCVLFTWVHAFIFPLETFWTKKRTKRKERNR